ncbi:MAG: TetR/AcrR family transcriptional regulator [Thomasclavelia sp.]
MKTKDKILKQAYKLYQTNGFNNVTIQDICKQSKITKPTFYKYFKNKEDTIIHLYDDITKEISSNVPGLILADNYYEQLLLCFLSLVEQSKNAGFDIIGQMFKINLDQDQGSFDFRDDFSAICLAITKKGQEANQFLNTSNPYDLYKCLSYAFTGFEVMWCLKKGDFDFEGEIKKAIQTIYQVDEYLYKKSI